MKILVVIAAVAAALASSSSAQEICTCVPAPASGFKVVVTESAKSNTKLAEATLHLRSEIAEAVTLNPKLSRISSSTTFWITDRKWHPGMITYHPSATWLSQNGHDPAMARGIELFGINNFLIWNQPGDQPLAVLHELSHAYHHRYLDWDNTGEVAAVYNAARASGKYNAVRRYTSTGPIMQAYAMANKYEYFAEITEAYFGANDFQPFNRAELKTFDPKGYALMVKVWG